jgi:hypothetical protein
VQVAGRATFREGEAASFGDEAETLADVARLHAEHRRNQTVEAPDRLEFVNPDPEVVDQTCRAFAGSAMGYGFGAVALAIEHERAVVVGAAMDSSAYGGLAFGPHHGVGLPGGPRWRSWPLPPVP